jgi:hypothetical protein
MGTFASLRLQSIVDLDTPVTCFYLAYQGQRMVCDTMMYSREITCTHGGLVLEVTLQSMRSSRQFVQGGPVRLTLHLTLREPQLWQATEERCRWRT